MGRGSWDDPCAHATRGRRLPSLGLMARLGVPVGGRVECCAQLGSPQPPLIK